MQWGSGVRLKQIALSSIDQFNGSLEKSRLEPDICFRFSFETLMHCPLLSGNAGAGVQPVIPLIYVVSRRTDEGRAHQERNIPTLVPQVTLYHFSGEGESKGGSTILR